MKINEDILTDEGKVICELTNIFTNKNKEIERLHNVIDKINDEVEILEEEKKIPKKLGECAYVDGEIGYSWSKSEAILKNKINEIIDYLDYLKSKGE